MKQPSFIQFIIRPAEEGGYYAEAIGYSIYTQGETIDEVVHNIREAVTCHFSEEGAISSPFPILANLEIPQMV